MLDFLIDTNTNEFLFKDGDFAFGDSTKQNQLKLLKGNKGDYKQSPMICVGVMTELNEEDTSDLIRSIRIEFVKDGMMVNDLKILPSGTLGINAEYKNGN